MTIEEHLDWCRRRELRPNYVDAVRMTLRRLERSLGCPLEHATSDQLERWWTALSADVSAGTRVAYAAHVSSYYRWAVRERLRADDPTVRLDRPRLRRNLPRPMAANDLRRAIDEAHAPVRAMLLLAAYMGLRACEIANLHRDDLIGDVLIVRDGKGGKQRIVPLHSTVAAELDDHPAAGWLFPTRPGEGPMRPNTVSARVNRYLHDLGISDTLHQCRHYFATSVYRASRDLRLTQELLGHRDPKTTANYAAWEPDVAVAVVRELRIPDFGGEAA